MRVSVGVADCTATPRAPFFLTDLPHEAASPCAEGQRGEGMADGEKLFKDASDDEDAYAYSSRGVPGDHADDSTGSEGGNESTSGSECSSDCGSDCGSADSFEEDTEYAAEIQGIESVSLTEENMEEYLELLCCTGTGGGRDTGAGPREESGGQRSPQEPPRLRPSFFVGSGAAVLPSLTRTKGIIVGNSPVPSRDAQPWNFAPFLFGQSFPAFHDRKYRAAF